MNKEVLISIAIGVFIGFTFGTFFGFIIDECPEQKECPVCAVCQKPYCPSCPKVSCPIIEKCDSTDVMTECLKVIDNAELLKKKLGSSTLNGKDSKNNE